MKSILQKPKVPRGFIAVCAIFVFYIIGISLASHANANSPVPASGQRLITVYDQGETHAFLTKATTLRRALQDSGIRIDPSDLVEPGLDDQLVAASYDVNIYRARPVTIVDGATRLRVLSPYQTPKQIVEHAGMTLHDEDRTTMSASNDIIGDGTGIQLAIERATPLTLMLYGKTVTIYTQAKTIAELLKEKGITLAASDTISAQSTTPITANMTLQIWRNGVQTVTQDEDIAFPIRQIQDPDQPVGYRQIQSQGIAGKKMVTYQITMQNGQEVSRSVIQSVVTSQPTEQVEVIGSKPAFSGDFAAALLKLRTCEAGGNYANKNNPLYRGAYQFSYDTWADRFGIYDPADASPAQQDQAAHDQYMRSGWRPWPVCGASLPDTYR